MNIFRILVVEDDELWSKDFLGSFGTVAVEDVAPPGYDKIGIEVARDQQEADRAVQLAGTRGYELVLLDLRYPVSRTVPVFEEAATEFQGMKWLPELRRLQPDAAIVIITAYPYARDLQNVVDATRGGLASDFVPKTAEFEQMVARFRTALSNHRQSRALRLLEEEFHHVLIRSRAASILSDDIGRVLEQGTSEFLRVAETVETGDPSAVSGAPNQIRSQCRFLKERYATMVGFFGRIAEQEPRPVDLKLLLDQMILLYSRRIQEAGATSVVVQSDCPTVLTTFASDVRIALHEILWNAVDALKECRTLPIDRKVEVRVTPDARSQRTSVHVIDNGEGFSDDAMAHLFEPRASTRKDAGHQGIGLYIAKHVMQAIGGGVVVKNRVEGGAEVVLTIPDLAKR